MNACKGLFSVLRDRLKSADSVEKVGFGFHGRKVRARD
ncbi:hypothetical protein C4K34_3963 [Pseudomonas chlororaphis subsp. piscium]|nr:hypothetical protein C4K34_3963 [Pseudomonas chlororaphis subsp. piscium]